LLGSRAGIDIQIALLFDLWLQDLFLLLDGHRLDLGRFVVAP
jgi:hypothetical protein